jgi:hypothetical protein
MAIILVVLVTLQVAVGVCAVPSVLFGELVLAIKPLLECLFAGGVEILVPRLVLSALEPIREFGDLTLSGSPEVSFHFRTVLLGESQPTLELLCCVSGPLRPETDNVLGHLIA